MHITILKGQESCTRKLPVLLPLLVSAILLGGVTRAVQGQVRSKDEDIVTIALVDDTTLPDGNVFISRNGHGNQRNVVLLRRSLATSGVLEHAMQEVVASRRTYGHVPKVGEGIVMHDNTKESSDPATKALFQKLLAAPRYKIPGVGSFPAVAIHLTKDLQ